MTLGQRLYDLRKAKGLSQENVAEKLGVTRQTVSKWETDQTTPDFDKILPLCCLYGISTDELLKGKDEIPEENRVNNSEGYYYNNDTQYCSQYYGAPNEYNSEEDTKNQSKHKKKFAALLSAAICLYILSVIPFFAFKNGKIMMIVFFAMIAVATMLIVYGAVSKPKAKNQQVNTREEKLFKQITGLISSVILVIYLAVSFLTGAWYITWILWIVYGIICEIVKLIFMLKGVDINNEE